MPIDNLISQIQKVNEQVAKAIKDFKDSSIANEIKYVPGAVSESLKRIELISQSIELKVTLQREVICIRKLIESRIGLIETSGTNYLEKIQAVELLGNICNHYLALEEIFQPSIPSQPVARWNADRLRLEQQVVCEDQLVDQILKKLLGKIKKTALRSGWLVPNQCFISYAWAGKAMADEQWIQPFLDFLRNHLRQAGINALIDIKDNPSGGNIYQYMNRIKGSDCVIVVGTQSLFQQHEAGVSTVCNELILIEKNRAQQQTKTLPILLSGCFENALPAYFFIYSNVADWRKQSYVANLKKLLASIYEVGIDSQQYQQLWAEFEQKYPLLMVGFPEKAVNKILSMEAKLEHNKKEQYVQQAIEMFCSINQNLLNDKKEKEVNQVQSISWEKLIECVKEKYTKNNKITTSLDKAQEISSCYINLSIVEGQEQNIKTQELLKENLDRDGLLEIYEKLHGSKRLISLQDLFKMQDNKKLKYQLILGRAGIGKSVLCHYLAYQWAKEGWWKDEAFKLLIWIPLRFLTNDRIFPKDKEVITLGKVFYELYKDQLSPQSILSIRKEEEWIDVLDKLIEKHVPEILYVLDGFDEVASICQLNEKETNRQTELLRNLLTQEQLIITSRPYYIDHYLSSQGIVVNRRLENIGFVNKDIDEYVQRYPWREPDQKKALLVLLNNNRHIKGIAHIPIHLALICRYWQSKDHTSISSSSLNLTTLYEALVSDLLYEHLGNASGKGNVFFTNATVHGIFKNKTLQPILSFLEKLAFLQMQDDMLIIKKTRINILLDEFEEIVDKNNWQGFKTVLGAGLLVSPDDNEKCFEERREHYFIHLTFQEFLAARYIAQIFKEGKQQNAFVDILNKKEKIVKIGKQSLVNFMQKNKYNLRYEIVWQFVAGLLKEYLIGLNQFFDYLLLEPRDLTQSFEYLLWIRCLEECELATELKDNLIEEIKERTQALLNGLWDFSIMNKEYLKVWFDYLFSSPKVFESLKVLQNPEDIINAEKIFKNRSNFPEIILNNFKSLLKSKDLSIKKSALEILKNQLDVFEEILIQIMDLLEDQDFSVRTLVLDVFKQQVNLPDVVINYLIRSLEDKKQSVKNAALKILKKGKYLSSTAEKQLILLLTTGNMGIKELALNILWDKNFAPKITLDLLLEWLECRDSVEKEISLKILSKKESLPEGAIASSFKLLEHKEPIVRELALRSWWKKTHLIKHILSYLLGLLEHKESSVRWNAAKLLKTQDSLSQELIEHIIKLLKANESGIKWIALEVLEGQLNFSSEVVNHVTGLLRDEESGIRWKALIFLCEKTDLMTAINYILALLRDGDLTIRETALQILRYQRSLPEPIVNGLFDLLEDINERVRSTAKNILSEQHTLPQRALIRLLQDWKNKNTEVGEMIFQFFKNQINLSECIVNDLVILLENENVKNVILKILSLYKNLPEKPLYYLIKLVGDKKENLRKEILKIIENQEKLSNEFVCQLIELLQDKKETIRLDILQILKWQKNLSSLNVNSLLILLQQEDKDSIGKRILDILITQVNLEEVVIIGVINLLRNRDMEIKNKISQILCQQSNFSQQAVNCILISLKDKNKEINDIVCRNLIIKNDLPEVILIYVIRLLKDEKLRSSAWEILNSQKKLSEKVISKVLDYIKTIPENWRNYNVTFFITKYFYFIINRKKLQIKLSIMTSLLVHIVFEKKSFFENAIYFKNERKLVIIMENRRRSLLVSNKEEFIMHFYQRLPDFFMNKKIISEASINYSDQSKYGKKYIRDSENDICMSKEKSQLIVPLSDKKNERLSIVSFFSSLSFSNIFKNCENKSSVSLNLSENNQMVCKLVENDKEKDISTKEKVQPKIIINEMQEGKKCLDGCKLIKLASTAQLFQCYEVEANGDCGYTAFGITRDKAHQLLTDNIIKIQDLLNPIVKETLLIKEFVLYLQQKRLAGDGLLKVFNLYQQRAQARKNIDKCINELKKFSNFLTVVQGFIDYDVLDKKIDNGWSHPCILQALAEIQGIALNIYQLNINKEAEPHKYYPTYISTSFQSNPQTVYLLFSYGNHFERLELIEDPSCDQQLALRMRK